MAKLDKIKLGHTGLYISRIGLGTWSMGGGPAWGGDKDREECIRTIQKAPELGINLIDTAPAYNFGTSEGIVGEAVKNMERGEVIITTKCGIVWNRKGSLFNKVGDRQLYKNLSKESIMAEIEESLDRLDMDYVDIYMTHWQSVEPFFTPVAETMEALNELKSKGKIKAIGASNISVEQIREYLKYGDLDIVQGKYSVLDRGVEQSLFPICKQYGITMQAYSPLEQGLLSGRLPRDYVPVGARSNKKWFQPQKMMKAMDMMDAWEVLCRKYDCTVPMLALAWILAQGDFVSILNGAHTVRQLEENARAMQICLSKEDADIMRTMAENADREA